MIRFRCPNCDGRMEVDESFAGRPARCPTCGAELHVPSRKEADRLPTATPVHPGVTTVRVGEETLEVLPPVETMAVVSLLFLGASVAAVLVIGLTQFFVFPGTIGATIGAGLALLAAMTGLPAYHSIRRSRGRKRGRPLAAIGMIGGAVLVLVFGGAAVAGWVRHVALQPTCEENLEKIYSALKAYAGRHDGKLPENLDVLVTERYLDKRDWLTCPEYRVPEGTPTYVLYIGNPPVDLDEPIFPRELMIVSDGAPYDAHPDGMVRALLLGGEVKKVPVSQWPTYRKDQARLWGMIREAVQAGPKTDAP